LRTFLREYVDSQVSTERRTRKRFIDTNFASGEEKAPVNAPKWALAGYNGMLKEAVETYSGVRCTPPTEVIDEDDRNEEYQPNRDEANRDDNEANWDDNEEDQDNEKG